MITSQQSMRILSSAWASGEWQYTQGGARGGVEVAKNLPARQGDCTDFTWNATKTALGSDWKVSYANAPRTSTFHAGTQQGYTEVEASAAQPGDIVVRGGHAGVYMGTDKKGNVWGWANNGLPATPKRENRDSPTGNFNFSTKDGETPQFFRPTTE
jgi:hypothetical protein